MAKRGRRSHTAYTLHDSLTVMAAQPPIVVITLSFVADEDGALPRLITVAGVDWAFSVLPDTSSQRTCGNRRYEDGWLNCISVRWPTANVCLWKLLHQIEMGLSALCIM